MRVAILGAGFAGLATTWSLLAYSKASVTIDLYDPLPIGTGISGISSGLLHAYAGKEAKKAKFAEKKMDAVHALIHEAAQTTRKSIVSAKGILRPAISATQIENFKKCATENNDVEWWTKEQCEQTVPGLFIKEKEGGGIFIKTGLTLDVPTYLYGLWQACARLGTQFHQTAIIQEKELKQYDYVIFALGYALKHFKPFENFPIETIKGQVLTLKWPTELPPLPFSLVSEGYLAMTQNHKAVFAGATFERQFQTAEPELDVALPEIRKKIAAFFPAIASAEVLNCQAGIRAACTKDHLPLVGRVDKKLWFITGLGSKGLLYHGWLGQHLAHALIKDDPSLIPLEVRYPR